MEEGKKKEEGRRRERKRGGGGWKKEEGSKKSPMFHVTQQPLLPLSVGIATIVDNSIGT